MEHLKRFVREDDGAELIEWAIGLGIVALLAGVAIALGTAAQKKIVEATNAINNIPTPGP